MLEYTAEYSHACFYVDRYQLGKLLLLAIYTKSG